MDIGNDNYKNEEAFLLAQAKIIVGGCIKPEGHEKCSLQNGGACPLLGSLMSSFKSSLIPK